MSKSLNGGNDNNNKSLLGNLPLYPTLSGSNVFTNESNTFQETVKINEGTNYSLGLLEIQGGISLPASTPCSISWNYGASSFCGVEY